MAKKKNVSPEIRELLITDIVRDPATKARVNACKKTIAEYAALMDEANDLPPPVVFWDGERYFLADGLHRILAALELGYEHIDCDVKDGGERVAILYAFRANTAHGLKPTNADKRRIVQTLLEDPEWCKWSHRQIADHVSVSHTFVSNLSKELAGNGCQQLNLPLEPQNVAAPSVGASSSDSVILVASVDGVDSGAESESEEKNHNNGERGGETQSVLKFQAEPQSDHAADLQKCMEQLQRAVVALQDFFQSWKELRGRGRVPPEILADVGLRKITEILQEIGRSQE